MNDAGQDYTEAVKANGDLEKKNFDLLSELEGQCKQMEDLEFQLAEQNINIENLSAQLKSAVQELESCSVEKVGIGHPHA